MSQQLLKDPSIFPDEEVLEKILKEKYLHYQKLLEQTPELEYTWKFYNDGKAWLCKATNTKKKTIFRLSVWEGYFKISFFFTERTRLGVLDLDIEERVKKIFSTLSPTGKLVPLIIDVKDETNLDDVLTIVDYKKRLK